MSELPAHVVEDILSRLPVETLLRFRCVSKPWRSLIDSTDFIKSHLNLSIETKNNLILILLGDGKLYTLDFELLDKIVKLDCRLNGLDDGIKVSGSCNGLLCFCNSKEAIILWNPSTRKYRELPIAPIEFPTGFPCKVFCECIAFGFGHDFVNDDYKVVRMVQFNTFESEVKVYSLKSNSWRRIPNFPYYLCYEGQGANGMLASGALHWVVSSEPYWGPCNVIAAFDIGIEEFRSVPQPEFADKNFDLNIGVLGGCLCILCNYFYSLRFHIWVMKEYGVKESWTKLFTFVQPNVICSVLYGSGLKNPVEHVRPIAYSKSGREVLLAQDNNSLFWYDLKRTTVKSVRIPGMPNLFSSDICLASLVPLNSNGQ